MAHGLAWAEAEAQVLGVTGLAEFSRASGRWAPLASPQALQAGDRIRTREKSAVDVSLDRMLSGILRLDERTEARLEAGPSRWVLERGKMWILWEYENDAREPLEIRSAGMSVRVRGGASLRLEAGRLEIRSFGNAWVDSESGKERFGELDEGWRAVVENGRPGAAERLTFGDYQNWRTWMLEAYRYKDEKTSKSLP